jgi:asparagine synthase (glutamine-hydrolysing)
MCGIAGEINLQESFGEERLPDWWAMQETLLRRGPDQRGLFWDEHAALIHARLAVVDVARGRQPMHLDWAGRHLVMVYNGEIYNTEDLRRELLALGHEFRGHSDTEVVLHCYAEWGEDCVGRLNGIFAFAIWEAAVGRLFIARDRFGVKPLFFARRGDSFIFGSEIKAIFAHQSVKPQINLQSLAEIFYLGPGRTPGCGGFCGIEELPPACAGVFDEHGWREWQYWQLRDREHKESFAETAEHVRFLVTDAIQRQLVSDVPLGCFLSGGLDSSLISAVADRYYAERGEKLQTFSVTYRDNEKYFKRSKFQPNSDEAYIRQMNDFLHAENHFVVLDSEDLAPALFEAVDARDLPGMADVDSSLLLFCRKIKEHVTVAVSGECADEIFGGYPWYRDPEVRARYGFPWAQSTAWRSEFLLPEVAAGLDGAAYIDERYRQTIADCDILPEVSGENRRVKEMMALNLRWFMQTLLDRKDRMSMYSGLEVRVPFCDYRIAEYLYGVPWAFKDWQGQEKGLLREAMRGWLPDEVLWRKKSPYPKTHNPVYMAAVSGLLREVLADGNAPLLQFCRRDSLEKLLASNVSTPWYGQLMLTPQTIAYFLQVNYWLEKFKPEFVG